MGASHPSFASQPTAPSIVPAAPRLRGEFVCAPTAAPSSASTTTAPTAARPLILSTGGPMKRKPDHEDLTLAIIVAIFALWLFTLYH